MVQAPALCLILALRQRQQLHFFTGNQSLALALKVTCVIMKVRAQSCLTAA